MRWRFIDPKNQRETAERNGVAAKIDAWWREFQGRTGEIVDLFTRKVHWDLPEWMNEHLGGIDSRLMWEYGPAVNGSGHRLVITPESAHHLRPLVRAILERAPAVDGWEFYEYRLAENLELARVTVEARTGQDIGELQFRASRGEHERVDVSFCLSETGGRDESSAFNAAFVATESLLGEQCLNTWIGAIEIVPAPRTKGLGAL